MTGFHVAQRFVHFINRLGCWRRLCSFRLACYNLFNRTKIAFDHGDVHKILALLLSCLFLLLLHFLCLCISVSLVDVIHQLLPLLDDLITICLLERHLHLRRLFLLLEVRRGLVELLSEAFRQRSDNGVGELLQVVTVGLEQVGLQCGACIRLGGTSCISRVFEGVIRANCHLAHLSLFSAAEHVEGGLIQDSDASLARRSLGFRLRAT